MPNEIQSTKSKWGIALCFDIWALTFELINIVPLLGKMSEGQNGVYIWTPGG